MAMKRAPVRFGMPALLVCASLASGAALAQDWPAKPVRIIAPSAAGGTGDTLGRLVAQKLTDSMKQSFIVENRPGAGGVIACDYVAKSPADGYTLVVSSVSTHAIAPVLSKNFPFDPMRDFTHIALFGGPPSVLVVHPNLQTRDLGEFIAHVKSQPGRISYGSPGPGTHGQLIAENLKQRVGIDMLHVPYKGANPAIADLVGGHIPVALTTLTTAAPQIRAGKIRPLAVSAASRVPDFPDLPTFAEAGYPDLTAVTWFSLSGPADLPQAIVQRLNTGVRQALQHPDVRERLRPEGIEPGTLDAQAFTAFVAAEIKRWAPVVRASGAQAN